MWVDQVTIDFGVASDWLVAGASFLDQSQNVVEKNQSNPGLRSTLNWKPVWQPCFYLQLDEYRESPEPRYTPVESDPVQPQPSAFPTKTAKKTKPSKKIISQTVVYKEKEKVPKSKRKSSQQRENTTQDDSVVTSPTRLIETVESGEELMPADGEETGEELQATEQRVEDDGIIADVTKNTNDVKTKPEKRGETGKEQEIEKEKEKEKDGQEQKEEKMENLVPKGKLSFLARHLSNYNVIFLSCKAHLII